MEEFDAVVLGAGAAGLMCAAVAGQRGRRVLLLDHADRVGAKILISGGGRCNFTNIQAAPDRFLSANPHFMKSALSRYTQDDFIALVERHGIAYHEKTLGQLFCDGSSRQIVEMLLAECAAGNVDVRTSHHIAGITHADSRFHINTHRGEFSASRLVVSTGGPAIPKMGATGFAYDLARQFGLKIVEPRPALVPLTFGQDMQPFRSLSGVSLDTVTHCGKASFREASLFTHRGLSGPAILQISSYWRPREAIRLDLLPGRDAVAFLKDGKRSSPRREARTLLAEIMPTRLAEMLAEMLSLEGQLANLPDGRLEQAARQLNAWTFVPTGTEGFAKAEVTAGGVDTAGLSSKNMEARTTPGLHFIGEAVDVTGWLGGYNFQWAWSSAWCAAQAI